MATNNTDSPNYKGFLESIEYDSDEVLKYFNKIKGTKINHLKTVETERDAEIASFYDEYLNSISVFESMKYNILDKYFNEYSKLNETCLDKLTKAENLHIKKRNDSLSVISIKTSEINSIKLKIQTEFFEAKKKYQKNINEVSRKMDQEYEKHMTMILDAKEKMLKNAEFFLLSDDHIDKIEKTINFLNEYKNYHKDIEDNGIDSITIDSLKLSTYIEYLEGIVNELDKIRNELKESYKSFEDEIVSIQNRLIENTNSMEKDFIDVKRSIKHTFFSLSGSIDEAKEYFDNEISKTTDLKEIASLKETEKACLDSLNSRKERLSLDLLIENEINSRKNDISSSFLSSLLETKETLSKEYANRIDENTDNSINYLKNLKEAISNVLNNVKAYNGRAIEDISYVHYCNSVINKLEIDKKIESLTLYKEHLEKIRKNNKDLDVIAFEMLTSGELLAIKILELRKEFIIADDSFEIEKLKYEFKIKELKETRTQRLVIENSRNDIEVLRNELASDKQIIKKELETKTNILDRKKELDLLRAEYLIAYKRIDNIQNIINIEKCKKPIIDTLKSEIKIRGITELVLLDAIGKKKDYDERIEKFENSIKDLDYKCDERVRYMNNVLEIVKNDFDEKKKEITKIADQSIKSYHPHLRTIKKDAGRLIENTKSKYAKLNSEIESLYKKENETFSDLCSQYESINNEFISSTLNSIKEYEINNETTSDSFSKIKSIVLENLNSFKSSYNELINDNYFKNKINNIKETSDVDLVDSCIKKIKSKLSSNQSFDVMKEFENLLNKLTTSFLKHFTQLKNINKPMTLKEKEKREKAIKNQMNSDIADLVIKTTFLETPSIESIYSIEDSRDKEIMEYEKSVSDYKNYYIETMDKLKEDYNTRYSYITSRIDELKKLESGLNDSMNEEIVNAYTIIKNDNSTKNSAYVSQLTDMSNKKKGKHNEISSNMKKNDDIFQQESKIETKKLDDFTSSIMEKVNKYKNYIEEVKRLDRIAYDRKLKSLEDGKELEFKNLENNKELDKAKFKKRKEKAIIESERKKINNVLEYGKINDSLRKEILSIDEEIRNIYAEFEKECYSNSMNVGIEIDKLLCDMDSKLLDAVKSIKETN